MASERICPDDPQLTPPEPRHVPTLGDALQLASFVTSPEGKTYRADHFDAEGDTLSFSDEATGETFVHNTEELRGWTLYALQPVTYD